MLKLFRLWYNDRVYPKPFLESYIFCLNKTGDGSNPFNYRPLLLLNTDYKLFTRVLAMALKGTLAWRVHANHHGFVPFRDIHAVLDFYMAAQATVPHSPELRDAVVMLLGFAKAYDTLGRKFLYEVLSRHGYPPYVVELIRILHTEWSVSDQRLEVKKSPHHARHSPIIPPGFNVDHSPLYQQIDWAPDLRGIRIATTDMTMTLKISGYSDDTALYLRDRIKSRGRFRL